MQIDEDVKEANRILKYMRRSVCHCPAPDRLKTGCTFVVVMQVPVPADLERLDTDSEMHEMDCLVTACKTLPGCWTCEGSHKMPC